MALFKKCTKCHEVKPAEVFPAVQRKRGPVAGSWCRDCYRRLNAERAARKLTVAKACTKCGATKTMGDFPPAKGMVDGRGSWCRGCVGMYVKEWRARARSAPKVEIDGKECSRCGFFRHKGLFGPAATASDGLHSWCRPCIKNAKRLSRATEEGKERTNAAARTYRRTEKAKASRKTYRRSAEYRLKHAARVMVRLAVEAGVLKRPDACPLHGEMGIQCKGRIEGHHHNGYDVRHWLDVVWTCQAHHRGMEND